MRVLARIFGYGSAVVAAVLVAGFVVLQSFDLADIQRLVAEEVKAATGRDLQIDGRVEFSISLTPTLLVEDVRFSNASRGSRADMARIKRIEVGLDVLALLQGEVKLTHLSLFRPDIVLEKNESGVGNWQFNGGANNSEGSSPPRFFLENLEMAKAKIAYRNGASEPQHQFSIDKLSLANSSAAGPTKISIRGQFANSPVVLDGTVSSLYGLAYDPARFHIDLKATALDASIATVGTIERPLSFAQVDAKLTINATDTNQLLANLRKFMPGPVLSNLPVLGPLDGSIRIVGDKSQFEAKEIALTVGQDPGLTAKISGSIGQLLTGQGAALVIAVAGNDLRSLAAIADLQLAKSANYRVSFVFRDTPDDLRFDNLELEIGANQVKGNVSLGRSLHARRMNIAISAGRLNIDELIRLLPAEQGASPQSASKGVETVFSATPLPLDALEGLDLSVKFVGKEVQIDRLPIRSLSFWLQVRDGGVQVDPINAHLAGGRIDGRASIRINGAEPAFSASIDVQDAQLRPVLEGFQVTDLVDGRFNAKVDLSGRGTSIREIMGNLGGKTELIVDGAEVKGRYLDLLATDLVREIFPWSKRPDDTPIKCLVSRFNITDGVAVADGMLLETDQMAITGGGKINLRNETLDLRLNPRSKKASLVSLSFPVDIGGTFRNPTAAPTPTSIVKGVAGLALGLVNPLSLLLTTASSGSDGKNRCQLALNAQPSDSGVAQTDPKSPPKKAPGLPNPVKGVGKILKGVGSGIGNTLNSIFGGGSK